MKTPTFEKSIVYSLGFHLLLGSAILIFSKFDSVIWKKPPPVASVVWTQSVKRPKPTIPDKLPPPMVPQKKVEEAKPEEINIKKPVAPVPDKKVDESRLDKMKKALAKLKTNQPEDDRPAPREDNFPTEDPKKPDGVLSDTEIVALQASSIYSAYRQQIKEAVQSNFIWFRPDQNFVTVVSMKVDAQGNISNVKIAKSSGDSSYDQATLRAVQKSNPIPPPPPELVQLFLQDTVEFNFERKNQ